MMPPPFSPHSRQPASIRSLRLIYVGLMLGVVGMTVLAALNVEMQVVPTSSATRAPLLLALATLGFTNPIVVMAIGIGLVKQTRARIDTAAGAAEHEAILAGGYGMRAIITAAVFEGWGLLGAIALLLTGDWLALGAPVITCAVLIAFMPSEGGFRRFSEAVMRPR